MTLLDIYLSDLDLPMGDADRSRLQLFWLVSTKQTLVERKLIAPCYIPSTTYSARFSDDVRYQLRTERFEPFWRLQSDADLIEVARHLGIES